MNMKYRTPNIECRRREGRQFPSIRRGFTLVEVMMVTLLAFLVFSAMAAAMSHAFRLWNDAHARWRLAVIARRTRVIFLDGARNEGEFKGTGFLSCDRAIQMVIPAVDFTGSAYQSRIWYHYPALNPTNEMAYLAMNAAGSGAIPIGSTNLCTPFYTHLAYSGLSHSNQWNGLVYGYFEGTEVTDPDREWGDYLWFADFSIKSGRSSNSVASLPHPENLYVRRFIPDTSVNTYRWDEALESYYMSLSYELVYFSGGKTYVHPEYIRVRLVNLHY